MPIDPAPSLLFGGDWRYTSKQVHFTTNQDNPLLGSGAYSVVNARVSVTTNDEKLTLTGYVTNLLQAEYRAHTLPAARDATGAPVQWGEPAHLRRFFDGALVLSG